MYMVSSLKRTITVEVLGLQRETDLTFADGMIGVLPVFESREQAEQYAEGAEVLELKYVAPPKD